MAAYVFPDAHVVSARVEPDLFVRLRPPDSGYELVHDAESAGRTDRFGRAVTFSVSDGNLGSVSKTQVDGLTLVCREEAHPRNLCGVTIEAHGAVWSVLIPPGRLGEAARLVDRASVDLDAYRVK